MLVRLSSSVRLHVRTNLDRQGRDHYGGSRGIGRATAIAAAARGFEFASAMPAMKPPRTAPWFPPIEARNGHAIAVKCDVGSESDILALFQGRR